MRRRTISLFHMCVLFLLSISFVVASYLLYVTLQHHHISDNQTLDIQGTPSGEMVKVGKSYRVASWNIGWGAHTPSFTDFQAEGKMHGGRVTQGTHAKAVDKSAVEKNLSSLISQLGKLDANLILLQEVDEKSGRSWHVNERDVLERAMQGFESVWAENMHSAYLLWPVGEMLGSTTSGLLTLSRNPMEEAWRRSYPPDESFPGRYYQLDPCFSIAALPVENSKTLYVINSQMQGSEREEQWEELLTCMLQIQEEGNYAICGGDFGIPLAEPSYPTTQEQPAWASSIWDEAVSEGITLLIDETVPTRRATDIPWEKGTTYTAVTDGFLATKGVKAKASGVDGDFAWSDHQPVLLEFILE